MVSDINTILFYICNEKNIYFFYIADYIKSCASLEVCRQVIVAFDSSGLGRITFSNFKDLMCSLKLWHGVFKNHSKEKSGILKADRLRDALNEVGFQLNSAILSVLMMRYIRKDGTLRFGDFVAIILNLSIAFGNNFTNKCLRYFFRQISI